MLATIALTMLCAGSTGTNLVDNSGFEMTDATKKSPVGYQLSGSARWEYNGYQDEVASNGVSLDSYAAEGSVSQLVKVDRSKGKWVTFRFRAKAEDAFAVKNDALFMQIDFYSHGGTNYLDSAKRLIYREILNDRKDFTVNGDYHKAGAAVWRSYDFEELLPFAEVDAVKVSVGFKNGAGTDKTYSRFLVDDFSLTQSDVSATAKVDPADAKGTPAKAAQPVVESLIKLGGRWFYKPAPGEQLAVGASGRLAGRLVVTEANSDRLFYKDHLFINPFAGNMTAWLRKGYIDQQGNLVQQDRLINDNVTVTFDGSDTFAVTAHNIPNHPTARFPDTYGSQGYNPSYIREQVHTYRLPIDPKKNPQAIAMAPDNSNYGLNMGAIGFAVNGVVFYNPFDANMTDASSIMDRCCGHPSPDYRYHYHKYPICVNTPFVDKGEDHSPLIGFAFDGFPVYGPYETKGVLARDLAENKLDSFNAHYDAVRGWHYHVTPGKFPYLIGGYMGYVSRGVGR
jgi:hypothetical protein